jgi:hypothetical protein
MQHQPAPIAAKTIGQDNVGARIDKAPMKRVNAIGVGDIPEFGAVARRQAHFKEVGARGAVGQKGAAFGKQSFEHPEPRQIFAADAAAAAGPRAAAKSKTLGGSK